MPPPLLVLLLLGLPSATAGDVGGCCFSIGFGNLMKPCCLRTEQANDATGCETGERLGGASGFITGACPLSAEEAAALIRGAAEERAGCCFSVGFGAYMRPCCLSTREVSGSSLCNAGSDDGLLGGSRGFRAGDCPRTAAEAAQWLEEAGGRGALLPPEGDEPPSNDSWHHDDDEGDAANVTWPDDGDANDTWWWDGSENSTREAEGPTDAGCCFSLGLGDNGAEPCCLRTEATTDVLSCDVGGSPGGTRSGYASVCPESIDEAAALLFGPALTERGGCCFSVGFGAGMRPCCLTARHVDEEGLCLSERSPGGASAYRAGACPASASEASQWMAEGEGTDVNAPTNGTGGRSPGNVSELPGAGGNDTARNSTGCCFSYGSAAAAQPCCLRTLPDSLAETCEAAVNGAGGVGFALDGCPSTPQEAVRLVQEALSEVAGCCYSIGYAAFMKPCCLSAKQVASKDACPLRRRLGGATGYTPRGCPATAEQASEWLSKGFDSEPEADEPSNGAGDSPNSAGGAVRKP